MCIRALLLTLRFATDKRIAEIVQSRAKQQHASDVKATPFAALLRTHLSTPPPLPPTARLRLPAIVVNRKGRVTVKSSGAPDADGGEGPAGAGDGGSGDGDGDGAGKKGPTAVAAKRVALGATPVALTCGLYKARAASHKSQPRALHSSAP